MSIATVEVVARYKIQVSDELKTPKGVERDWRNSGWSKDTVLLDLDRLSEANETLDKFDGVTIRCVAVAPGNEGADF